MRRNDEGYAVDDDTWKYTYDAATRKWGPSDVAAEILEQIGGAGGFEAYHPHMILDMVSPSRMVRCAQSSQL